MYQSNSNPNAQEQGSASHGLSGANQVFLNGGPPQAVTSNKQQTKLLENGSNHGSSGNQAINGYSNTWIQAAEDAQREAPPMQTFEKTTFQELMDKYEGTNGKVQSAIDLGQALLMTNNFKETAANINNMQVVTSAKNSNSLTNSASNLGVQGSTKSASKTVNGLNSREKVGSTPEAVNSGASYFFKQDYMADLTKKCAGKDFEQVTKLLSNLGSSDKSSNWFLEQRNLMRTQTSHENEISNLIDEKIVDNQEYVRQKENIAQAKHRSQELLDEEMSDADDKPIANGNHLTAELETEEDSGQATRQRENDKRINGIIKRIRQHAQVILGFKDGRDYSHVPLTQICKRLRKDESFLKKRQAKQLSKGDINDQISKLRNELNQLSSQSLGEKFSLVNKITSIEQVLGMEKRMKTNNFETTLAELDMKPMNADAFDIQNILFDYCGIDLTKQCLDDSLGDSFNHQKRVERLFCKIRKMPKKSCLLQNFDEHLSIPKEESKIDKVQNSHQELVKVIGLEPEKLFEKIPKYRVNIAKMPKFSNTFDNIESVIQGINNRSSIPGQQIINSINANLNFNRIDGRQVISLQFNPFFINDDLEKKKIYDSYMREIIEQRDRIKNAPKEAKNKQETANIKRAWANIVKKDIPKAYRLYQKFKADQETNNKKLSQNCLKEVRKRAVKTQRLAKESVMRARKLTKEMCHYWRKRDKELADVKRKREKMDKELKKRQQEEEEALLQKKRLEYLMQQSEIYAHFMATKLGVHDDLQKGKKDNERGAAARVDIDLTAAKREVADMINENRKRLDDFDDHDRDDVDLNDLDEQKLNNPMALNEKVQKPDMFLGDLKAYQLKGLQWLDNLYDQGINGILADEMGLGKTIQTIALLAHLAEKKDVWGPFLIVVPVTTLHNWQNELAKFCPNLKVLPYFGSAEERKKLAKFLDPKNMYNPAMRIHVLITSYNLIVGGGKDQMRLQRIKWHYMILDEAQAIKNNASRRWKTLLNFNTRNRLLLSGTPIQNSMAELWALLHFIMPKLFDNHEQFQEWFSKDIEQHSMDQGELNKHQLKRLHLILQPFMLRRLKKDVEQEIAPKIEEIIHCDMTHRQKVLYNRIKSKISTADLFQLAQNKQKMENLMNLVMQFRKVCNHPDLFERRMGKIPFMFCRMQTGMLQNMSMVNKPDIYVANYSPITFELPKMVYDECFFVTDNNTQLFTRYKKNLDQSFTTVSVETHFSLFNIFNASNLHNEIYNQTNSKSKPKTRNFNLGSQTFSILGLLMRSNNWSVSDISFLASTDKFMQTVSLMHFYLRKTRRNTYMNVHQVDEDNIKIPFGNFGFNHGRSYKKTDIVVNNFVTRDEDWTIYRSKIVENLDLEVPGEWAQLEPIVPESPAEFMRLTRMMKQMLNIYYDKVVAEPINFECTSHSFKRFFTSVKNNPVGMKAMIGKDFKTKKNMFIGKVGQESSSLVSLNSVKSTRDWRDTGYQLLNEGVLKMNFDFKGSSCFQLPDYSRLVTDCSKMSILADLLRKLHIGGHRCLIFCQMTRMMDILEDFLIWQKYSYFRMDGQTQLQDRRFMVEEFQKNPNIFIFILSTRAGGLGINLIAADTVIFYDNDWNPTMDSQATDRAHRIGQTKTVRVYRLVTKNSVEERILRRARQKESVQSTVYGANLKADSFTTRDVLDMIIDDVDEDPLARIGQNRNQVKGFIKTAGKKDKKEIKRKKKKNAQEEEPQYEKIKRAAIHEKFENEIDQLLDNKEDIEIKEITPKKEEDLNELASSDDENMSDVSDNDQASSTLDRKQLLLKMIEKQSGGAKQVFAFEEEDNIPGQPPQGEEEMDEPARKKRGRPAKTNKVQLEEDDEEMDDDNDEY